MLPQPNPFPTRFTASSVVIIHQHSGTRSGSRHTHNYRGWSGAAKTPKRPLSQKFCWYITNCELFYISMFRYWKKVKSDHRIFQCMEYFLHVYFLFFKAMSLSSRQMWQFILGNNMLLQWIFDISKQAAHLITHIFHNIHLYNLSSNTYPAHVVPIFSASTEDGIIKGSWVVKGENILSSRVEIVACSLVSHPNLQVDEKRRSTFCRHRKANERNFFSQLLLQLSSDGNSLRSMHHFDWDHGTKLIIASVHPDSSTYTDYTTYRWVECPIQLPGR